MSLYILDTDCFSLWQQNHPMMVQRVEVNADNLAVTIVTLEEVIRGWFNVINQASAPSQADKLVLAYTRLWDTLDLLQKSFSSIDGTGSGAHPTRVIFSCGMGILPVLFIFARGLLDDFKNLNILKFDQNASTIYTKFHRQIRLIGTQDLRIAAIVLANNAILVTRNKQDFEKVPNLVQEDWTIQP